MEGYDELVQIVQDLNIPDYSEKLDLIQQSITEINGLLQVLVALAVFGVVVVLVRYCIKFFNDFIR